MYESCTLVSLQSRKSSSETGSIDTISYTIQEHASNYLRNQTITLHHKPTTRNQTNNLYERGHERKIHSSFVRRLNLIYFAHILNRKSWYHATCLWFETCKTYLVSPSLMMMIHVARCSSFLDPSALLVGLASRASPHPHPTHLSAFLQW